MATATNAIYPTYTNISSIKDHWMQVIAPNYFDFSNINNYSAGIFGYVNEVMGNVTEDSFNAIANTRRESYPVTAQFISSLYQMAALQSVEIPLTKPSSCRCALFIPQDDVINYSERVTDRGGYPTGTLTCHIDNSLKIFAGDLQFMLDFPIEIISMETGGQWAHTVHYDINSRNSLNEAVPDRYLSNKIIAEGGSNYIAIFIDAIRQLEMVEISKPVMKDPVLNTVTIDVDFDGNLANFEVFYKANANSEELQLAKVMINGAPPVNTPYILYELINNNKLRFTIKEANNWHVAFNSEIIVRVYTSEGSKGNFNKFTEDLVCSSDSDRYPYNTNMTILGRIYGSATGGADQLLNEEFRSKIIKAYATNNTISTENDLQLYFNDIADDINGIKILFKKKRDDVFIRLYGAYTAFKDSSGNIIPTNTLETEFYRSDILDDEDTSNIIPLPAGSVVTYKNSSSYTVVPVKNDQGDIKTIIDIMWESRQRARSRTSEADPNMYFALPFMANVNTNPISCGYYLTSVENVVPIEYTFIEQGSFQQFIGSSLTIYRNQLAGNNFYRLSMTLTQTAEEPINSFIIENNSDLAENQIRAAKSGMVVKEEYYYDEILERGYIRYTVRYDDDTEIYIQGSNTMPYLTGEHTDPTVTGYKMNYAVGETFAAGNILAVKRCTDLGRVRIIGDLGGTFRDIGIYVLFSVQDYVADTGSLVMEAYLLTDDLIDSAGTIKITRGIFDMYGNERVNTAVNIQNQMMKLNAMVNSQSYPNYVAAYGSYVGFEDFTRTNEYTTSDDQRFDLIKPLSFVRSTATFSPIDAESPEDNSDFRIVLDEVPYLEAIWAGRVSNFDDFVYQYTEMSNLLNGAYKSLNNSFSIDTKFYNTYGKARFFTVGNNIDEMVTLDSVRCKFHFGVKLATISNTDNFILKLREYIQSYIEDDARITNYGQDLYIMNMISSIRQEFEEILYMEYYGFNSYDYRAQKVIGPDLTDYQSKFIPEFLNLNILYDRNGDPYPEITIDILP